MHECIIKMIHKQILYLIVVLFCSTFCEVIKGTESSSNVKVNKCCERYEIYIGRRCTEVNKTEQWTPIFTTEQGHTNWPVNHTLIFGLPDCGHMQRWPIYQYPQSTDRLKLLPNGILRHYFDHIDVPGDEEEYEFDVNDPKKELYHDYVFGKYCLDRSIDEVKSDFAWVCAPEINKNWLSTNEFILHNIVSPATHVITIVSLLIISIIYFIMPTLRDLTGNIITTICMCLIFNQAADMIRLLTVFTSHNSLMVAETISHFGILGAFFWLNSLGYYIWKTFRSRNVFLRITDGKKYCYYGGYAWSCTIVLGVLALFSHYLMDYPNPKKTLLQSFDQQREQFGSLAMIIFFVPVAFTILIDVFFVATTMKTINKMHTYGRIHHKLRHSFRLFVLLLLVMTVSWLFFLSSFWKFEGLVNTHIIFNAFLGPLILYVCVFNQKHVSYLLRKSCCYNNVICPCCRPQTENDWGDEMTAMNTDGYH